MPESKERGTSSKSLRTVKLFPRTNKE